MKKKSPHPAWARRFRTPGTELRCFSNKYYLYEVSSRWNPKKGRSQKISGKLIGRITKEEGLIPSEKRQLREKIARKASLRIVSIKEYGASQYLLQEGNKMIEALESAFPGKSKLIFATAFLRLMYQSPIKNMAIYANESMIGEFAEKKIDDKVISLLLRDIGSNREPVITYMKRFMENKDSVLIDMTHMISHSKKMLLPKNGYKKPMSYQPQVNLMYIFSSRQQSPSFYRLVPGNIKEVKAFTLSIKESGLTDVVLIGDKGFYSKTNREHLQKEKLQYILPLKRDSSLIDYSPLLISGKDGMQGFFEFEKRFIWHYTYSTDAIKVTTFLDEKLKLTEEHDYLTRLENKKAGYTMEGFKTRQRMFGTLSMIHDVSKNEQEIYCSYKSRANIETMFDAGKNILDMDITYMQNEHALEGWLFIHHIALQLYYIIYNKLVMAKLISKYSVSDMLLFLSLIRKVNINNQWHLAETTKPTQNLLDKLGLHIT